ncbi:MAG TPA: DUF1365 domain-containing protein [Thermoanaerobaculia bacterium]|jgi:DUF1365 family protein|nr:DUF1365 domain-containing protein [Thermoanaerobaculia bacterium]
MESALYVGTVRHRRFTPKAHSFDFPLFLAYLDLDELETVFRGRWLWSTNRANLVAFRREDYHGDPELPLDEAVRRTVELETGRRPTGPIRLLTHLRTFGHVFNPVSFYYCFAPADAGAAPEPPRLEAVLSEITNTPWGERQAHVVRPERPGDPMIRARHRKELHVSPFMNLEMDWEWRISTPGEKLAVRIVNRPLAEGATNQAPLLDATLLLRRRPITGRNLAAAIARFPFMPLQVVAGIHWQALRLWWKGLPIYDHPAKAARRTHANAVSAAISSPSKATPSGDATP